MPTAVVDRPAPPLPNEPWRKRWTRQECAVLESSGLLDNQHLELVEGELINKMGKKWPHGRSQSALFGWLMRLFGEQFVCAEMPINVAPEDNPTSEPEPDLILLARTLWQIQSNPGPEDLRLVIEIADTTLQLDLTTKAGLYARAGIADYWVLDVRGRRLIVNREPQQGVYQSVIAYNEEESVSPLAAPDHEFPVAQAFPGE